MESDRFIVMKGLWGLRDQDWGYIIAGIGLVLALLAGLLVRRGWIRRSIVGMTGFVFAFLGLIIIGGGGPVGMGVLVLPLIAIGLAEFVASCKKV